MRGERPHPSPDIEAPSLVLPLWYWAVMLVAVVLIAVCTLTSGR